MGSRVVLDAGAALGAAALVISGTSLLAQHSPGLDRVLSGSPGGSVAGELRAAELASGAVVLLAGGVAAVCTRAWWPLLLAVTTVGGAIAVYEAALRWQGRGDRDDARQ